MATKNYNPPEYLLSPYRISSLRQRDLRALELLYDKKKNPNYASDFLLLSDKEVMEKHKADIKLLDSFYTLEMFACCEAYFKNEYLYRCNHAKRDPLSVELQALYMIYAERTHFDDILKIWSKYISCSNNEMQKYIGSQKYRNWLAHGRYWTLKVAISQYDYNTVECICIALIEALKQDSKIKYHTLPNE